ncbi:MAG: DUF4105 domain-containing protein [Bacteroidota bacterium]
MRLFALLFVLIVGTTAESQLVPNDSLRFSNVQISVLTCGTGEELYGRFGHTGLRVSDPLRGADHVYNWGTFDFDTPGFYIKFLRGQLDYTLSRTTFDSFLMEYHFYQRPVDEQVIHLKLEEKKQLLQKIQTNYLPKNRNYKYDFFFDNCVTRIRDLIESLDSPVVYPDLALETITYRGLLHTHLEDDPWIRFGMDLILGARTDAIAGARDQMFLPFFFRDYMEGATLGSSPIVASSDRILDYDGRDQLSTLLTPVALFYILLFLEIVLTFCLWVKGDQQANWWYDRLWFGILGFASVVFVFMWFGTDHEVCSDNYNLLWSIPWALAGLSGRGWRQKLSLSLTILLSSMVLFGQSMIPQHFSPVVTPAALISIIKSVRLLFGFRWLKMSKITAVTILAFASTASISAQSKMAGITVVAPPRPFTSDPIEDIVDVHANWIALVPYGIGQKGQPVVFHSMANQWWGEKPEGIAESARLAHEQGVKIMLKPQVWIPGGWVGDMDFEKEAEWKLWEKNYRDYLMTFVDMAIKDNIEMICIGTEYKTAVVKREAFWRQLIADIRSKYDGLLTYSSNWDSYKNVPFWDELDYIGISGYFPLSSMDTPPVLLLSYRWRKVVRQLQKFSTRTGKQILFTEYGYLSVDGAAGKTWELERNIQSRRINQQAQANGYEALFRALVDEPFWAGGFLWKWFPEGQGHEGYPERDYTPQHKKAQTTITKWYGQMSQQ